MRVWLIRHAAAAVPPGVTIGAGDPPLTAEGRAQSQRLAASLSTRPLARVWSSDLRRAVETASIVAAPFGLTVATTPALRELDFGAWEGRVLGDLWHEDPDAARAWETDITATPDTFGESVRDLLRRVRCFWDQVELSTYPVSPDYPNVGEVAIVAHRGSLAALQSVISGESFALAFRFPSAWVEVAETNSRPGRSASRSPRRHEA